MAKCCLFVYDQVIAEALFRTVMPYLAHLNLFSLACYIVSLTLILELRLEV